jgi:ParB family chromosome partitioning protein
LKAWLFGGQEISIDKALFDLSEYKGQIIGDLFGKEQFFADSDAFWTAQNEVIAARSEGYLEAGWSDVVVVPPDTYFHVYEFTKAPKRKGGRVYIDVRASGEVTFHEGYLTAKEAKRLERGEAPDTGVKPARPEVTSTMQTYIDLHRHAAVRAALTGHPKVALRLMVAHAITGSHLWSVKPEPQTARSDEVRESVETCRGEADFDEKRRAVLALLGFSPDEPTVTGGNGDDYGLAGVFLRLLDLPDRAVMDVIVIVIGETLAAGSAAVEAVGMTIGVDMARYWQADDAFFELLRDKEVLTRIVAEVAGETVAAANAKEKGKTLKRIVADHLAGGNGRAKVENWVPRWMAFPPSAYTTRGGVGTVKAHAKVEAARRIDDEPDPTAPGAVLALPAPAPENQPVLLAA